MDHQEDELLIALHEAQMVLSEAARPLQELRQEMQQLRREVRQLRATPDAPLPSWGARRGGRPGRAAARACGGRGVEHLGSGGADHPGACSQSAPAGPAAPAARPTPTAASSLGPHSTRTLLVHHQVPFSPEGPARFGAWLRRRGRDPLLGTSSQHGGSYRAAARLAISVHVTGRTNPRPITCTEIDVQEPEKCWVRLNKCTETAIARDDREIERCRGTHFALAF